MNNNNNNNKSDDRRKEKTCWFVPFKCIGNNKVKLKVLLFCNDVDDYFKEKEEEKGEGKPKTKTKGKEKEKRNNVIEFDIIKSLDKHEKDNR